MNQPFAFAVTVAVATCTAAAAAAAAAVVDFSFLWRSPPLQSALAVLCNKAVNPSSL